MEIKEYLEIIDERLRVSYFEGLSKKQTQSLSNWSERKKDQKV